MAHLSVIPQLYEYSKRGRAHRACPSLHYSLYVIARSSGLSGSLQQQRRSCNDDANVGDNAAIVADKIKIDKDSVLGSFYRSIDLVDLFPLLHVLDLFPDGCKFRRSCLNVRGLREKLQHVYMAVAIISVMVSRTWS
jgi:hypothetical protein